MSRHVNGRTVIGASGTSVWIEDGVTRIAICNTPFDAAFVSEAMNVAHETGRTPAQLAEERAELVAILERLIRHCESGAWAGFVQREQVSNDLDDVGVILAKVKK